MGSIESHMRDVSRKTMSLRTAKASSVLCCQPSTIVAITQGTTPKAEPLAVARIAGIQAAKNTSTLIPYCHQVPLDFAEVSFVMGDSFIAITSEVRAVWKTGVEMEALTAVTVASLALYDMLKPIDHAMTVGDVKLLEKTGGKTGVGSLANEPVRAGIIVMSDRVSQRLQQDTSGMLIKERLEQLGIKVASLSVVPDSAGEIANEFKRLCDEMKLDLVLTTGGTGVGPRDVTPEVTSELLTRALPGVEEAIRAHGQERTPFAMLGRGVAGIRGETVVINLPGSPSAVSDALDVLFPGILHALPMMKGQSH